MDEGGKRAPEQSRDVFWDNDHIAPLYSLESAKRTVHPLIGSASMIKFGVGGGGGICEGKMIQNTFSLFKFG